MKTKEATGDEYFMERALRIARKGQGWVSPNPMVGAVIVKDGAVISEGYHRRFGEAHAEVNAITNAKGSLAGATLYVTLEPCCHFGKTPPCTDAVIESGIARVVIGVRDPNPSVSGRGIARLNEHRIHTTVGVLESQCRDLNEVFFKYMTTAAPFVTLKYAQTVDGRIAAASGNSRWISSDASLRYAHELRSHHDAVLVGIDTVLRDNPELTVRHVKGRNPLRVILDSTLKIPLASSVLAKQDEARTMIITTRAGDAEKMHMLGAIGIEIITADSCEGVGVDLSSALRELSTRNISSVLVEGGARTITSFIRERLPDRLIIITAPKIMGKGIEAVGDLGFHEVDDAIKLVVKRIVKKGDDIIMDLRIKSKE